MNARQGFIGQSVVRREDQRFLTGVGQYTDDIALHGQSYGYFLRSPHAHAKIKSLNTGAAAKADGVLGSFIGVPSMLLMSQPQGKPPTVLKCSPVKMPSTPSALAAAPVLSDLIFAWACGLRKK